jgi:dipeptidyl aminopeptidase/acylaminoacyl peptidase
MKKLLTVLLGLGSTFTVLAQENLSYQKPPKEILELVDYERPPSVSLGSKSEYMLFTYRDTYKTLDELSQDELRLGGLRINPKTNISSSITYLNNLKVRKLKDREEKQVSGLPANPKIANLTWSPDETKIAFTHTAENGVELWVLDVATASAKKLGTGYLNANTGNPINWMKDSKNLLVNYLPANRKALINTLVSLPTGPIVSTAEGKASQNRTYQDLLKNPADEQNFETLITSELQKIDLNGKKTAYLPAGLYADATFSPDGNYLLVTTVQKPFSYIVPYSRFPSKSLVYDMNGKLVKEVNALPLNETLPKGFMAVRTGKRSMNWRADEPATLVFVEALDGGDPAKKVEYRDEVFTWKAPFTATPKSLLKTTQRYGGITWGNEKLAVLRDQWYDTRSSRTFVFDPSSTAAPRLIFDRNSQDIYSDPGSFETTKNQYGRNVLAVENGKSYLIGAGHTKEGQFPFIDELDWSTLKTNRVYQSAYKDKLENILSIKDIKTGEVLVMLQSATDYPNYYIRNLKNRMAPLQITDFKNPFVGLEKVHKEVIKYKRKDGVDLSGTLYLPAGYNKKDKLPLLIWAYPQEFVDKNSASQSTLNPNQFTFPAYGSFVFWAARGYAVLNDAAFPIVGENGKEPNDTFVEQLIANAEAAIHAVDALGYIDPKRVGVGGHSYGAFMTANLLTHSKLFAVGIARSGAYNRTLTPFGFQREQRNYWDAPDVYNTMSPFMNAHKMKTPMLLVHGEADNNPGTFTLQTERYFQALKGLGAPARMVILPKESHGYAAKENILHLLWEQDQFLEKHLKK